MSFDTGLRQPLLPNQNIVTSYTDDDGRKASRRASLWCDSGNVLLWARVLAAVTSLAEGYAVGVVSGVAPLVKKELHLSTAQMSVYVALGIWMVSLGTPLGSVTSDAWGRRAGLILAYLELIVGCLLMAFASEFRMLALGRAIEGVSIGSGISIVMTYMSEVTPAKMRGYFNSFQELFIIVGITSGYICNAVLLQISNGWRIMLVIGVVAPTFGLVMLLIGMAPESPRYLLAHGQCSRTALDQLVGTDEAEQILQSWEHQATGIAPWSEVLRPQDPIALHQILAAMGIQLSQVISGISIATVLVADILTDRVANQKGYEATAVAGALRIAVCLLAAFNIERAGRRTILLVSSIAVTISLAALGFCFMVGAPLFPWKFGAFCLFLVSYELGLGPVPYVYAGEVLDNRVRSKAVALGFTVSRLYAGLSVMVFMLAAPHVGLGVCFEVNALCSALAILFIYFYIPETTGVPLEQMSSVFRAAVRTGTPGKSSSDSESSNHDSLNEGEAGPMAAR